MSIDDRFELFMLLRASFIVSKLFLAEHFVVKRRIEVTDLRLPVTCLYNLQKELLMFRSQSHW